MFKVISSGEMVSIDLKAQKDFHIPGIILMENAGLKCWQYIESVLSFVISDGPLVFVAGSGNNGGDSLVMARHAASMYRERVLVVFARDNLNESTSLHAQIIYSLKIPCLYWSRDKEEIASAVKKAAMIVDGISGTGLKGQLKEESTKLVNLLNTSSAYKVAIDIPSGLGDNFMAGYPCFKADTTLAMGLPKYAHYLPHGRSACGIIKVINPGFPEELLLNGEREGGLYTFADFSLPVMSKISYKSTRGHVGVFAGSVGYTGAAVLAASSAGRTRTGLVTLHIDGDLYEKTDAGLHSVMVRPLAEKIDPEYLSRFSAFLAGPGWGTDSRKDYLLELLRSSLPGVIDADGIRILASLLDSGELKSIESKDNWVLTPHPGEFEQLTGIPRDKIMNDPLSYLLDFSVKYRMLVVLKSHVIYIVSPDGTAAIIDGMNPAMGTGGSGDILAGIIAGFIAQGISPYNAAVNGVLLHQKAGSVCFQEKGWFLAEDLLPYISILIKEADY